jgi:DNA polymerase elongation subunit (family B)
MDSNNTNVFTLHSYDAKESDDFDEDGNASCRLTLWCLEAFTSSPKVVTIIGFRPECYIELPRTFTHNGMAGVGWSRPNAMTLASELEKMCKVSFRTRELVMKSKLYYFQPDANGVGGAFPMLKVSFASIGEMKRFASKIEKSANVMLSGGAKFPRGMYFGFKFGRLVLRVWEADNVSSLRRFMTQANMTFAGWFRVKATEYVKTEKMTKYTVDEIIVVGSNNNWQNSFEPLSEVEALKIPMTAPKIMAFDIEAYSNNHKAMPNPLNEACCAYMISCVFQIARDKSTRKRILIFMADASVSTDKNHPAYKDYGGTTVDEFIEVEDESTILKEFLRVVERFNPDILTGYNIAGFDYKYLDLRFRLLVSADGKWPLFASRSRIGDVTIKTSRWKSGNYGFVETSTPTIAGRLSVDMLPIVKRDYKMSRYNLDSAIKFFFGEDAIGKHGVSPKQMFEAYEEAVATRNAVGAGVLTETSEERVKAINEMTKVAAYAVQDSELVVDLFEKINTWAGLVELSSVAGVSVTDTFTRGQQCRIISLLFDNAHRKGVVLDKRKLPMPRITTADGDTDQGYDPDAVISYTGGYVGDPTVGMHDNVICVDFSSLYPSIMIAYNISHDTLDVNSTPLEDRAFSGKIARYDRDVIANAPVAEKKKAVISGAADAPKNTDPRYAFNLKGDENVNEIEFFEAHGGSKIDEDADDAPPPKAAGDDSDPDDVDVEDGAAKEAETTSFSSEEKQEGDLYTFRFASRNVKVGLLPELVSGLLAARKATRKKLAEISSAKPDTDAAKEEQSVMKIVLHQRQLAYKVIANSTYGFIGAQKAGMAAMVEGAMSITARGRQLIQRVNSYVKETYNGEIVYGDTDSSMFKLPHQIKTPADCDTWGHRLAEELSNLFPPPLKLEFEKSMKLICFKKKHYAALLINKDGSYDQSILKRGIVIARRDNCAAHRDLYEQILRKILFGCSSIEAMETILETLADIIEDAGQSEGGSKRFEIVKSVGSDYKSKSAQMAVFAAECAKIGHPMNPGERPGFVIVREPSSIPPDGSAVKISNLGLRMRISEVWEENKTPPLDMTYYLRLFRHSIDQLFHVAYGRDLKANGVADKLCFRPRSNVAYSCTQPLKMLHAMTMYLNLKNSRKGTPILSNASIAHLARVLSDRFAEKMEA